MADLRTNCFHEVLHKVASRASIRTFSKILIVNISLK